MSNKLWESEAEEYEAIFGMMLDCCEVVVTRTAMSDRTGTIQKMFWMNGEMYLQLHGGGLHPLKSVEVKRI